MKSTNKCLKIECDSIKRDLRLSARERGSRKLIVTEIYKEREKEAQADLWTHPKPGELCQVLHMKNAEMSFFNESANQDRHYHKIGTEIYMVIEGKFFIEVEGYEYELGQGDTLVVHPFSVHQVKNRGNRYLCRVINLNCGGKSDKYSV